MFVSRFHFVLLNKGLVIATNVCGMVLSLYSLKAQLFMWWQLRRCYSPILYTVCLSVSVWFLHLWWYRLVLRIRSNLPRATEARGSTSWWSICPIVSLTQQYLYLIFLLFLLILGVNNDITRYYVKLATIDTCCWRKTNVFLLFLFKLFADDAVTSVLQKNMASSNMIHFEF